jgi:hypothetical protein
MAPRTGQNRGAGRWVGLVLGALLDFVDLVGDEPVCLAMDGHRSVRVRRLDEAGGEKIGPSETGLAVTVGFEQAPNHDYRVAWKPKARQ